MKDSIQLEKLFHVVLKAGQEIMGIYQKDFNVEYKEDDSPLTEADQKAHQVIESELKQHYPSIPILSEEGASVPFSERKEWSQFWLVDPLDGTKEFIKKNGEFTVNIALIEEGYPSIGFIYAPALDTAYFGVVGRASFKLEQASKHNVLSELDLIEKSTKLPSVQNKDEVFVVASRSHMSKETEDFVNQLKEEHPSVNTISSGSSLKFCLVAEGKADFYPRYAPTMEWDTGAGQAIAEAAGKEVVRYEDGERFYYNRENLTNGWFLVK
ncbi:3'(2'),5'-bisphosphate nucleotidase [Halalkalibacillus sediminis]|uniref:3'(2'),5'-bisphosphate nucleotidase CysQ n=1 Tax=Halalkalibacillus sediminis TaxID=2018042 RepID=A0A2I0QUN6_9BACI|nr:3'(2'),5'-bisphosphate nucleotidase CysQ [Halalkalibacillus sediminis]PKR77800.1 3'(2'),5'-bisphosphate nucleotidase [Halalkalibacillus sediminis]